MKYQFKEHINNDEYDAFAFAHPQCSILQLSSWGDVKTEWKHECIGVYSEGQLVAAALLLIRVLPLGLCMGYMPHGPLLDFYDEELCTFFFQQLSKLGKKLHMISIKFDPNCYKTFSLSEKNEAMAWKDEDLIHKLESYGCTYFGANIDMYEAVQPRFQLCFHLPEDNDIRSCFPKKTRDKIKHATDYAVEIVEKNASSAEEFHQVVAYTEMRKGVALRNGAYYEKLLTNYPSTLLLAYLHHDVLLKQLVEKRDNLKQQLADLDIAAHNKRNIVEKQLAKAEKEIGVVKMDMERDGDCPLISGLLLIHDTHTTELLYSGLNEHYRQYLAPYLLRSKGIEWASSQGCKDFNFGGVQGTLDDGLFEFKSSFHPHINVYVGEFDYVVFPLLSRLLQQAIHIKKALMTRKVKKH